MNQVRGASPGAGGLLEISAAALLFVVLTAVMTWPLVTRMSTAVGDHGDPLLNSWILAWNAHQLSATAAGPWFDANIFYPHSRTLAWSEHLLPQSLLVAPLLVAGGGPILAHNLLLFLAFATNGIAMFLLARQHTGECGSAIVAGVVFAFSPFMFGHLWHLQVLCAAGIPLTFLFLERVFRGQRWGDALILATVFTAQILANGYYAVFASLLVPVFVTVEMTRRRLWTSTRLWSRLAGAAVIVAVLSAPFFAQYIGMQNETGLARSPEASTTWSSLLAVHPLNRLWGPFTSHLGAGERFLFPGLATLLLAIPGALRGRDDRQAAAGRLSTTAYLVVGAMALLLSFGSGPYRIVASLLPGFDAIRAVSRLHVFVMLTLALLAARGTLALSRSRPPWAARSIRGVILLALLVEYATIPIPWAKTFGPDDVPPIYRWIDEHTQRDDVLLELPIPMQWPARAYAECDRVYASTYHWRRIVNGYSGLEPPLYTELGQRWDRLAPEVNLRDAAELGVRWIVVQTDLPGGADLATRFDALPDRLRPVVAFEGVRLFEMLGESISASTVPLVVLPRTEFSVTASVNGDRAHLAMDGDPVTRWDGGYQQPGTRFEIDRGDEVPVCGVRLHYGPSHGDWPRGLRVEGSTDGLAWTLLAEHSPWNPSLTAWLDPPTATADVEFSSTRLRWLRLVLTTQHEDHYWSIHEFELLGGAACADTGSGLGSSLGMTLQPGPPQVACVVNREKCHAKT